MKFYPDFYCENIKKLDGKFFKDNNIKALILDVDNTLLDFDLKFIEGLKEWYDENVKDKDIKCIILSNSNKEHKVKMAADLLGVEYIKFATKPLKRGFKKAIERLELPNENIAVIGDQIFTDVIGANRLNMFSILVKPLGEKDIWMTRFKRPIENLVIKRYLKKQVNK